MNKQFYCLIIIMLLSSCNKNNNIREYSDLDNKSDSINTSRNIFIIDSSSFRVKRYLYVDTLNNIEKKYKLMDSIYNQTVNILSRDEWILSVYQKDTMKIKFREKEYKDTLIFKFTDLGRILENKHGDIGEWKLVIYSLFENHFPRFIILSLKNDSLNGLDFSSKKYRFLVLKNNIITLSGINHPDKTYYYFQFINSNIVSD